MEYLYHYTNLSSLALIFKNKTFRFNSLINMDDAEEVKTKNSPFLGKYCFISSWTDIEAESIPFWGLYTDNMSGIRIKMQKYPFIKNTYRLYYYENGKEFDSYIPESLLSRGDIYAVPTLPFLRKVEYTQYNDLIYPKPIDYFTKNSDGTFNFEGNFNDINKYKRDSWAFQSEWRYGFVIFPHDKTGRLNMQFEANGDDLPFYYYDVPIADKAFDDIEIITGPKMNLGDKEILRLLCKEYCPKAIIKESELLIN
ncbi:MAG: DUF2971 domain-containing protein [Lachnospiraceae bacterium]|nr:DUF2971 domain-containing protein [Lachnospiraceae bacterium]